MKKRADKGTLKKVLRYLGSYQYLIYLSALLALAVVAGTLYIPILIGRAIDLMVGAGAVDFDSIYRILLQLAVVVCTTALLQWIMNFNNNRVTYQAVRDIRAEAIRKIQQLPLQYLDTHPHGETVSRVISDVDQFADGLLLGFTQLFTGVVTILGTLFFMFRIHWKIALVVVCLTPISLLVARFIATRTYSMFKKQSEARGRQTAYVEEMISNTKVVQAFSHEAPAQARFDEINEQLAKASLRATFFSSLTNPCTRFVNSLVYAAVALTGALTCIANPLFTIGNLTCLLSYTTQYTKPFNEISDVVTEFQNALACASRVFELLEESPELPEDDGILREVQGHVSIDHVDFSYSPDRPLIENLNLTVKPGQRIALVGPTGCGKTTIINLLMRFYDVKDGRISVEGQDIRSLKRGSLRRSYGMVLQETWLKSGTIRENITMGKPHATEAEIIAAAKAAHSHHFIMQLPEGYDTPIGEDGGNLSQGQKQLLCITRIMLSLPPMLILDEATSSIDTRTELKIQNAFQELMRGRTSFIVAHRLSTIQEADVILVMKDGHIIEQGKHQELLDRGGFYWELYHSQFAH